LAEFEITGRYNVREDNMVIIDLDWAPKKFGFIASQNISECSFQKVGHDQKCVSNQTWSQCASMKLAVLASNKGCFFENKGLTLSGIFAKILCH
jgi:hypothetical protein